MGSAACAWVGHHHISIDARTGVDAVEGEDEEDDGLHREGGRPAREERLVLCSVSWVGLCLGVRQCTCTYISQLSSTLI